MTECKVCGKHFRGRPDFGVCPSCREKGGYGKLPSDEAYKKKKGYTTRDLIRRKHKQYNSRKEHLLEIDDAVKGTPKKDGSGKGVRANKGRGGCPEEEEEEEGKGKTQDAEELPSETVKKPGSFRAWCASKGLLVNGKVTEKCISVGLNSDSKAIQAKAKLARGFATMRRQKKAKAGDFNEIDFDELIDFIDSKWA